MRKTSKISTMKKNENETELEDSKETFISNAKSQ